MVDARCISGNPLATPLTSTYLYKQVRQNNRQLHKMSIARGGYRKANKAERFVKGFQLFDKVTYDCVECFIFGRRKTGYFDLRKLDGTIIHRSASFKKLSLVGKASTLLVEKSKREGKCRLAALTTEVASLRKPKYTMNIYVLVKRTFDTEEKIRCTNGKIQEDGAEFIINPYDEYAIEEAIQVRDANGGKVTVVTIGGEDAEKQLRTALAMGADEAVLINTEDDLDELDQYSAA